MCAASSALGVELPDLLSPTEFDDRKHPLFPECLKRHAMELSPSLIGYVFLWAGREERAREVLRRMAPLQFSGWLLKRCDPQTARRGQLRLPDVQWIFSDRGLELVLDRNAIPSQVDMDILLSFLDHARVVGDVPKGELSSLAVRLLNDIMERSSKSEIAIIRPGPAIAKYRSILREEDSGLIWRYLNEKGCGKGPAFLVVLSLLRGSRLQPVREKEAV